MIDLKFKDDDTAERFWSKVDKSGACWMWTSSLNNGYGQFSMNGRPRLAHRIAYTNLVGEIPTGLQIDHLCVTPACVNPDHLEVVTNKTNCGRGKKAIAKHCPRGHEYDDNYRPQGRRRCRECVRARRRELYAAKESGKIE